jgi:hypothetical protein
MFGPAKTIVEKTTEKCTAMTTALQPKIPSCLKWYQNPDSKDCYCMPNCAGPSQYKLGAEVCYVANKVVAKC